MEQVSWLMKRESFCQQSWVHIFLGSGRVLLKAVAWRLKVYVYSTVYL